MTWRDEYRPGSFRGVPFKVDTADSSHGRRQAIHEFAQRDTPQGEDLGRKAREFSVVGLILGKEYFAARDALITACETAGPGVLVHPYRGEMTVLCRGLSVSESAADGGMCRISMTFLEAGEASFPSARVDSVNAISKAGNTLIVESQQGFVERFVTNGFPSFVRDAAAEQLKGIADFLESPGFNLAGEIDAASDFYSSVTSLAGEVTSLVLTPSRLAQRIVSLITGIRSAFGSASTDTSKGAATSGNSYAVLNKLVERSSTPYVGRTQTPSRQQQASNYVVMNDLVRQVAVSEMSKEAVVTEFESIQDATKVRDSITTLIDVESERTQNDNVYVALGGLQTAVIRGVPQQLQSLPQLIKYTPRATLPSLLVAYQVYGDASRADEIARRNKPRHPGFLPGGDPLEVLADG